MNKVCRSILVGVALLAGPSVAGAADLGSLKDPQVPSYVVHSPARWYIRGDIGYAVHDRPTIVENSANELIEAAWESTWTLGGGVGYYFSHNVRGDITVDYRFASSVSSVNPDNNASFPGLVRSYDMTNTVALANLYYDLGDRKWFTPYVGIGLGFTRNTTETGRVSDPCGCTGVIQGKSTTSVAAALMAGFTKELRTGFNLDAGYRFLYLGDAATGAIVGTNNGNFVNTTDLSHLTAHEFRIGLRYDFGRW